ATSPAVSPYTPIAERKSASVANAVTCAAALVDRGWRLMNRSLNVDPVADTNCHEVLSNLQRPTVSLASHRHELPDGYCGRGRSEQDDVRVHGEPRLHALEE